MENVLKQLAEAAVSTYPALAMSIAYLNGSSVSMQHHAGSLVQLPNENSIFEIGSITKTFTGLLLAAAVKEGKASLSTTVKV